MKQSRVLVLGIGNLLMGDEGIGVQAARLLADRVPPQIADVVDGGTGGFHLLSCFSDYDPLILIDATMDGEPAGTVRVTEPRYPSDYPRALTAHDIGLRDLVETATLTGCHPKVYLVTISIDSIQSMTTTMSPEIEASVGDVLVTVADLLDRIVTDAAA